MLNKSLNRKTPK